MLWACRSRGSFSILASRETDIELGYMNDSPNIFPRIRFIKLPKNLMRTS